MAHHSEPMDVDSDFDNKENSYHHSNVLPCTEKGYEELDVSELNMKLRYSVTPAASPMSRSYTANCVDNRTYDSNENALNITTNDNVSLTRSLNVHLSKNDNTIKSLKALPLQSLPTDLGDSRSTSVLRPHDRIDPDKRNAIVTISGPNDIDENLSLPSTSSSTMQTPEATSPTKEIPRTDEGSPIMRGLKTVLNMFRSSQSPIHPFESDELAKPQLSPIETTSINPEKTKTVMASTPVSAHCKKENSPSKKNSPLKDSIVFNDDLEKELQWKDETTILFSQERIPIHKLFFQNVQPNESKSATDDTKLKIENDLDSTVEFMDISYNDSVLQDKTVTMIQTDGKTESALAAESDSEFVDCETTFTKDQSQLIDHNEIALVMDQTLDINITKEVTKKENTSKLKEIIFNTTQDILNATLSITPDDLTCENIDKTRNISEVVSEFGDNSDITTTKSIHNLNHTIETKKESIELPDIIECDQAPNITKENISDDIDALLATKSIIESGSKISLDVQNDNTLYMVPNSSIENNMNIKSFKTTMCEHYDEQLISNTNNTQTLVNVNIENISLGNIVADEKQSIDEVNRDINTAINTNLDKDKMIEILEEENILQQDAVAFGGKPCEANSSKSADITKEYFGTQHLSPSSKNMTKSIRDCNLLDNLTSQQDEVKLISVQSSAISDDTDIIEVKSEINFHTENQFERNEVKDTIYLNEGILSHIKTEDDLSSLERNNSITEHEFNIEQCESNLSTGAVNTQINAKNITFETTACDKSDKAIPENKISVRNASLPADLPLPEDDIENELIVTTLPLDLVDNIDLQQVHIIEAEFKASSDCNSHLQILYNSEKQTPAEYFDVQSSSKEAFGDINSNINSNEQDNITSETTIIKFSNIPFTNEADLNAQYSERQSNSSNIINETQASQEYVLELNMQETLCQSQRGNPPYMDTNEFVLNSKLLPDIINQTITSGEDSIDQNIKKTQFERNNDELISANSDQLSKSEISENTITGFEISDEKKTTVDTLIPHSVDSEKCEETQAHFVNKPVHDNMEVTELKQESLDMAPEKEESMIKIQLSETIDKEENLDKIISEKVILSENNSPYVYVTVEDLIADENLVKNDDNREKSIITNNTSSTSPPASPPISSKGYNFNFDEMEDPFATNTNVIMSTPPSISNESKATRVEEQANKNDKFRKGLQNRRKSQPERKRPFVPNKKLNSSVDCTSDTVLFNKPEAKNAEVHNKLCERRSEPLVNPSDINVMTNVNECKIHDTIENSKDDPKTVIPTLMSNTKKSVGKIDEISDDMKTLNQKMPVDSIIVLKESSSSEQSEYFTPGTSSSESIKSRNVFNIPEIDDMNFNPFATKSKMRQSPPLEETESPFVTINKLKTSAESSLMVSENDKIERETVEKDSLANVSNITSSSNADEKDATIREIHTEDEDTVEGPFLELDEDVNNDVKNTDFDSRNIDMMQFSELPAKGKEDDQESGEMFIDAEAFEFLLNQNKSNTVADSGKESLFLKFDPLFAKRISSDGVLAALNKLQKSQSTPTKVYKSISKEAVSPTPGPSNVNTTHNTDISTCENFNDDLNITVSKPMMVVPPAVNPAVVPRNKSVTPTRSNRRSVTFTSPAMAVIDRLLSLSGNSPSIQDSPVNHVSRQQSEANLALAQLRELLADKEVQVSNLRSESKELKDRLTTLESQVKCLEAESQDRLKKINDLNDKLVEKTKINKSMAAVVEEYERTIASLIAETEQDKKKHAEERLKLISERDEQTAHLSSMEVSFSDLHSKYEKSKQVIFNCKANEDKYKKSIKEFEESLTKMQNNYELLKQHATSKLNHANQELEKMNKAHEAEMLKLNAMIKRKELHITSLEESLTQKTKANEELTAICDELINKVG